MISTHAPAGGATYWEILFEQWDAFLLTPLREGRPFPITEAASSSYFYSRPCGRGDQSRLPSPCWCRISTHAPAGGATNARGLPYFLLHISTHAPAGGATAVGLNPKKQMLLFLLTPLREGRPLLRHFVVTFCIVFLLTPLREGRHTAGTYPTSGFTFLLTPLREGRRPRPIFLFPRLCISTHAPAGGATRDKTGKAIHGVYFYSRPCGRGDENFATARSYFSLFLLTPLREGRLSLNRGFCYAENISTHAPAGGATAIFHKSVMRFCGKLPKDDTVLCLASFGFPRRDPKAVYLAWISCANLPQKCVRQGLALKDQGTSCFHEGLASHAFVPVLV